MSKNPAVTVAKEQAVEHRERTLSTGVRVRVVPVSASLIMDVQNQIKYPDVPVIYDEEKDRSYENPNHPSYIRACEEVDSDRSSAAMDAVMMFGVELIDGIPDDDIWLRKLKTMDRRGAIHLNDYDLKDEIDLEFLYKKYIAVTTEDFDIINKLVGITEEGVDSAEASFPSNA